MNNDLFGLPENDPVMSAVSLLAQHDMVSVPGSIMRDCMNVLHILACDTEDINECLEIKARIHHIEAAWAMQMPTREAA